MSDDVKAIIKQALKLSPENRETLVDVVLDSLAPPIELTEEQLAELERRDRLYREDPSRAIPAERVFAEVQARLERRRRERETRADAS